MHQHEVPAATTPQTQPTVAVIGLGGMGIVTVKNLVEEGFAVTGFDTRPYYGGLWHFNDDPDELSVLESTQTNIPTERMCYTDFPFPKGTPSYCSAKEVQTYLESYVDHFNLLPYFQLNTQVKFIAQVEETGQWKIDFEGKPSKYFDKIVIATGPHIKPMPFRLQGQDSFAGTIIHSQRFKRPSDYAGKRVVVAGIGNTGADIANALVGVASKVYISHDRGAHILPRNFDGVPATSVLTHSVIRWQGTIDWLLPRLRNLISSRFLRRTTRAAFGALNPAWGLDDTPPATVINPITNDDLIPNLRAGRMTSVAGIERVTSSRTLRLRDGMTIDVDAIVCCIGYENGFGGILDARVDPARHADPRWLATPGSRGRPLPRLYQNVFSLDRPDALAFVGSAWLATGAFAIADLASMCIAQVWRGRSPLPEPKAMDRWMNGQARRLTAQARKATVVPASVDMRAWLVWVDETAGLGVESRVGRWLRWSSWCFWWKDRPLHDLIDRGIFTSAMWRLFPGPKRKAWDGARAEVERINAEHQTRLAAYKANKDL